MVGQVAQQIEELSKVLVRPGNAVGDIRIDLVKHLITAGQALVEQIRKAGSGYDPLVPWIFPHVMCGIQAPLPVFDLIGDQLGGDNGVL